MTFCLKAKFKNHYLAIQLSFVMYSNVPLSYFIHWSVCQTTLPKKCSSLPLKNWKLFFSIRSVKKKIIKKN